MMNHEYKSEPSQPTTATTGTTSFQNLPANGHKQANSLNDPADTQPNKQIMIPPNYTKTSSSTERAQSEDSGHQVSLIYAAPDDTSDLPSEFGDDDALLSYASSHSGNKKASKVRQHIQHIHPTLLEPDKPSELRQPEHPSPSLLDLSDRTGESENSSLNFGALGLIRREKEVASLQFCLDRSVKNSTTELVFISGMSGAGKTYVAETLDNHVTKQMNGTYVQGKFDLNTSDEPYSGIAKAIGKICHVISNEKKNETAKISLDISSALGEEMELFLYLIPELKEIVTEYTYTTSELSADADTDLLSGIERIRYAFRALVRIFSHHLSPMVIVLDDLQWADVSSLQVLDYVISDVRNSNQLMIIGCYRSDEADENSLLYNKILALRDKKAEYKFHLTEIEIDNFQDEDVDQIIQTILRSQDYEKTKQLASLCVRRTLGNPFFVIEFIKMLQTEQLIAYSPIQRKWNWDISKIEDMTMSTSNVVVLLQQRMRKLNNDVQRFMQCAACLGSSFTLPMLSLVWRKYNIISTTKPSISVDTLIAVIEKEQFVEACGKQRYRWIHDKVQEAALNLTGQVRPEFQFDAGSSLYYCLEQQDLEDGLFNVADLVNSGNTKKRPEFAVLNLRAAEKAKSLSAFQSAAKYAAHGISLLTEERWTSGRALTLRLYTVGYEMEMIVGNVETAEIYGKEVLSQESCTMMEKMPLKLAQMTKQCFIDMDFDNTIESILSMLSDLGCNLIWNKRTVPLQALSVLQRTIQKAKKAPSPDTIVDSIGMMTDKRYLAQINLVGVFCYAAYQADLTFLNAIGMCKLLDLTLKHGVADNSGTAFTGIGMLMIALKEDFRTAARFAETGLAIQECVGPLRDACTMFTAYSLVLPWYRDITGIQPVMDDIYSRGMKAGDSIYATWALLTGHVWIPFMMGLPLGPILKQCPLLATQMQELKQTEQLLLLKVVWQMIADLMSPSGGSLLMQETSFLLMEGGALQSSQCESTNGMHIGMLHFAHGELWLQFDLSLASERAIASPNKYAKSCPAVFLGQLETFHRGVALYAMARQNKRRRKYLSSAKEVRKKLQKWVDAGNPNVIYYHLFLNAEHASLKNQHENAKNLYEKAIELSTEKKDLRHMALFHERFASFLLEDLKDKAKYDEHMKEALQNYEEWGCAKKVSELKQLFTPAEG